MAAWRSLTSLIVVLSILPGVQAQTYPLMETPATGTFTRNQIGMKLTGTLKVQQEGKALELKQTAEAAHDYFERLLTVDAKGVVTRTARNYKTAKVVVTVNDQRNETALRQDRAALVVAQRDRDQVFAYCPNLPLTREELHVTEHFDTLSILGLLPQGEVKVGETWKISNATLQSLCNFEGLSAQNVTVKLDRVEGTIAHLSISNGTASGVDLGAEVKATIDAQLQFDLKAKRLVQLEWKQRDARGQGPVSPASTVDLTITLVRTAVEEPAELNDNAIVPVPSDRPLPPEEMKLLSYADPNGRYTMLHLRDWQLVGRTSNHLVLRLMDRGDFVAQATITPWKKAPAGQHLTGKEFQDIVQESPGWQTDVILGKDTKDEKTPNEIGNLLPGYWAYRVAAQGKLNGVEVMQYFYLLAGPQGDQLVLTFTMKPAEAQKLDTRDLNLLRGVTFPRPEEIEGKGR